ncbi:MAG: SRPBCC family protein [Bacteroidota bacterium]
MERTLRLVMMITAAAMSLQGMAQKKVKTLSLSKVMPVEASEVWRVVGEDYGAIAHSHPKIIASEYIDGSLKGGEGVERVCYFNEKETQYLKERMVNFDPNQMTFTNQVFQAGKFPVDPELTHAIYTVEDLGNGKSRMSFDMQYRTKPAFMGGMMKGQFKKLIEDYFIAIEHHIKTGESVTRDNFKSIKKKYKGDGSSHSTSTPSIAAQME